MPFKLQVVEKVMPRSDNEDLKKELHEEYERLKTKFLVGESYKFKVNGSKIIIE